MVLLSELARLQEAGWGGAADAAAAAAPSVLAEVGAAEAVSRVVPLLKVVANDPDMEVRQALAQQVEPLARVLLAAMVRRHRGTRTPWPGL